jgi:hypothetical protein
VVITELISNFGSAWDLLAGGRESKLAKNRYLDQANFLKEPATNNQPAQIDYACMIVLQTS